MPGLRRLLGAAAAGLALSAVAAAPASALPKGQLFGIHEQNDPAGLFADPRFKALEVDTVRYLIPWDEVSRDRDSRRQADDWYRIAVENGAKPLISFSSRFNTKRRPSVSQFGKLARLAVKRWPEADFQTWNEPNHPSQAVYNRPELVADFAKQLDRACKSKCKTIPASLVLTNVKTNRTWAKRFIRRYGRSPKVWGLHTYGDGNRKTNVKLATFLRQFPKGEVWITETAAWHQFGSDTSEFTDPSDSRQKSRVRHVMSPAFKYRKRVKRLYWYEWKAPDIENARWDSGLLDPDGNTRPAYEELLKYRFKR